MKYTITATVEIDAPDPYNAIAKFSNMTSYNWDTLTIIKHEDE